MNIFSLFKSKILAEFDSPFNKKIKVVETRGKRTIFVSGAEQTGGTITGMWQKAFSAVKSGSFVPQNCLLLGLGGGDVIRVLRKIYPDIDVTAVDIDPVMIKIASDYFFLDGLDGIKIVKRDALYFMVLNRKKFDLVVVDLFIGFKNPEKFRTLRFLKLLRKSLAASGRVLYNSHYQSEGGAAFGEFLTRCRRIFGESEIIVSYPFSKILSLRP